MSTGQPFHLNRWLHSRAGIVTIGFLAIATFFLVTEHGAHLFGFLPYGFLALSILMHLFMHGGHGGHGAQDETSRPRDEASSHTHHQHSQEKQS